MSNIETERKFIVRIPSIEDLYGCENFTESTITQIYISDACLTHRIRKREYGDGRIEYTENTKRRIDRMSSVENEREISETEYSALALRIEEGTAPLTKIRRTVLYCGLVFEFDLYAHWHNSCVMEVELPFPEKSIQMPPFVQVIAEVTGIKKYSNHSMAHTPVDERDHL